MDGENNRNRRRQWRRPLCAYAPQPLPPTPPRAACLIAGTSRQSERRQKQASTCISRVPLLREPCPNYVQMDRKRALGARGALG